MPFPTTGTLDDFNRSNENPLSGSGDWDGITGQEMQLESNQARGQSSGNSRSAWVADTFGPDCEAFASTTGPSLFDSQILHARLANLGASYDGYGVALTSTGAVTTFDLSVIRWDNGSDTTLATTTTLQADLLGFGIACIGDEIQAWVNHSGLGWTNPLSDTDTTYPDAGYVGLAVFETGAAASPFDNFGGGGFVTPSDVRASFDLIQVFPAAR